jgi:LPXTG-motif cell wall-anchored protein
MTDSQTNAVRWLFLAGMPGAVLFLGGLVWLRRRS